VLHVTSPPVASLPRSQDSPLDSSFNDIDIDECEKSKSKSKRDGKVKGQHPHVLLTIQLEKDTFYHDLWVE
jgi:hypothetical protein